MKLEVLAWIDFIHFERKVTFLERYAETRVKICVKGAMLYIMILKFKG